MLLEEFEKEMIPGMPANFRDLGGIKNRDGRKVKMGKLLRAGELSQISEQAKTALEEKWKLRYILDLRTESERKAAPDQKVPGAEYQILDFFENDNTSNVGSIEQFLTMEEVEQVHQYMEGLYRSFVTNASARRALRRFVDVLLQMEDGSVLFHCAAGKDRTGVSAAVILSILGVDREKIMEDYLQTNRMRKEANEILMKQFRQQMEENQDKLPEGVTFEKLKPAIGAALNVDQRYLENTFIKAEEIYGSFAGYVKEGIGVTRQEQEKLCSLYLE